MTRPYEPDTGEDPTDAAIRAIKQLAVANRPPAIRPPAQQPAPAGERRLAPAGERRLASPGRPLPSQPQPAPAGEGQLPWPPDGLAPPAQPLQQAPPRQPRPSQPAQDSPPWQGARPRAPHNAPPWQLRPQQPHLQEPGQDVPAPSGPARPRQQLPPAPTQSPAAQAPERAHLNGGPPPAVGQGTAQPGMPGTHDGAPMAPPRRRRPEPSAAPPRTSQPGTAGHDGQTAAAARTFTAKSLLLRRRPASPAEPTPLHEIGRPVQHRDRDVAPGLATEAVFGHLVITRDRVLAYYKVPLHSWSFLPDQARISKVAGDTACLSQLIRRRCHLRITSRPFEVWQWAEALDNSIRGPFGPGGRPARQVMPGPCAQHPDRSSPGCPTCVPGGAWIDWLQAQQRRLRQWGIADRDVYLGVELTSRGAAKRALGQAWNKAAEAERAALAAHAAHVTAAVAGSGLGARPVTPEELQWLYIRSCGLGLPAPLPVSEDPAPFPLAAPAVAPVLADSDELGGFAGDFPWTAEPFGKTVQVTRGADGLTAHVAALTLTAMAADQDPASDSPWIQRTDLLPFPIEWSVTFDVLDPRRVQMMMQRRSDRIKAQYQHIVGEHGQDPPPSMLRQMDAVRRIEEESENPESAGTWVFAWPRIAVTGATEEETLQRARQVTERYAPGITVKKPPDQYRILREFIPGEPLASAANRRFMHARLLVAGAPAATAQVGHRHGFPLGVTSRLSCRAVTWHPWYAMEALNRSGLVTMTGALGSGKSTGGGLLAYMSARAGIPTVVLDPAAKMDRLCGLPELQAHALAVNLLESPPGTLCPYSLIPEPRYENFLFDERGHRLDENRATEAWHNACRAAEVQRRVLCEDVLKMLLPERVLSQPGSEDAIGEAVAACPATASASPRDVIAALQHLTTTASVAERGPLLARRLETYADHPLTRLFFPSLEGGAAAPSAARLLTVMTLQGVVIPVADRRPEDRNVDEQLSIPVLHLAAQLLRRMLLDLPHDARKAAVLDEAHALTQDAAGQTQVRLMARDSRKHNLRACYISQNPQDLLEAGIDNLRGAAFAFRTSGEAEQAASCGLLGLPTGQGYEARLGSLQTGECLFRDEQDRLEQVQIDIGADPGLRAALNTTPGAAMPATRPGGQ